MTHDISDLGAAMARQYFPILKAKQGELGALRHWEDSFYPDMTPIVEVVPWERDEEQSSDDSEIGRAVDRIGKAWADKGSLIYIDAATAEYDPEDGWGAAQRQTTLGRIVQGLQRLGVNAAPLVRVSAGEPYIQQLRQTAIQMMPNSRLAIRITAEDLDDTVTPLRDLALRTANSMNVPVGNVDLILDFGAVEDDSQVAMAARLARFVLPPLADVKWRSLVLASGGFPVNLSAVAPYSIAEIPRFDLRLFQALSVLQLPVDLQYGDYAVTHPSMPVGVPFAAAPQLRYTFNDIWLVAKGRRQDRRGHRQFFDICAEVLDKSGERAPGQDSSWGDDYIHRAAQQISVDNPTPGPGNASTWRSIGTSHHLAYVCHRLSETGAP